MSVHTMNIKVVGRKSQISITSELFLGITTDHRDDFGECGYLEVAVLALVDMEFRAGELRLVLLRMRDWDDGIITGEEEMDIGRLLFDEREVGFQSESPAQILSRKRVIEGWADKEERRYLFRECMFGEIFREEDSTERVPDEDDAVPQERNISLEVNFPILVFGIVREWHPRSYDLEIPSECFREILITPPNFLFQ